jgi:hypothetical protein
MLEKLNDHEESVVPERTGCTPYLINSDWQIRTRAGGLNLNHAEWEENRRCVTRL